MIDKGIAHIGIGKAKGDDKAIEAVKQAVSSPLLETTIEGASHVIINISGDISLIEANEAASYVQELAGDEANIIFGAMYDENAQDEASITVIATGLDEHGANASVSNAMKGFTSNFKAKPSVAAAAVQAPHAAAPEAAATASSPYSRQNQGYTPSSVSYTHLDVYKRQIYRFMLIANNAPDLFGALLVVGVMGHIAIQVILNIAVVTNTIPNTGITLPFISYGGTSVLFLLMEMGVVLSVSNQIKLEK